MSGPWWCWPEAQPLGDGNRKILGPSSSLAVVRRQGQPVMYETLSHISEWRVINKYADACEESELFGFGEHWGRRRLVLLPGRGRCVCPNLPPTAPAAPGSGGSSV